MNTIYWLLPLYALISGLEAVRHAYVIEELKKTPNKLWSWIGRSILGSIFVLIDNTPKEVTVPLYSIVDWWIHDYGLNLFRNWLDPVQKLKIWELGDGLFDSFQKKLENEQVLFVMKTLALIGLILVYYVNY